jgi:hypothetical protein
VEGCHLYDANGCHPKGYKSVEGDLTVGKDGYE